MISSSHAAALQPLTRAQMNQCLENLRANFDHADVIHRRNSRIAIRWQGAESGNSIIIKMWSNPDLKGKLRRLLRVSSSDREWRNLTRLTRARVIVPRPLGCCPVEPNIAGFTDALFMEDMGKCELASAHLQKLIRTGQDQEALRFENALIETAAKILDAGMLDVDHGLSNNVVQASGRLVRLDLELARRVIWPRLFAGTYGEMLGRLIGMHAFAVQPDMNRSTRFAERSCQRLRPSRRVLKRAGAYARKLMQMQLDETGINTRLILPWD